LYSPERNEIGRNEGSFSVSSVLCALVIDQIWETSETPILPVNFENTTALIEHVLSLVGKVTPANAIRAKAW
jgi:hypothetical protein